MISKTKHQLKDLIGRIPYPIFRAAWFGIDFIDHLLLPQNTSFPIPPASLRYRIGSRLNSKTYVELGKECQENIEDVLHHANKNMTDFTAVLDFGCGCGRVIRRWGEKALPAKFYGTDIDARTIEWCQKNLSFGEFSVNQYEPPLSYPPQHFDLIYAISVFTHMDEALQFRWLEELKRVTRRGGIVLLSITSTWLFQNRHDPFINSRIPELEAKGILLVPVPARNVAGYSKQFTNTWHTKEYVLENFARYFNVLGYIELGMNRQQDFVILEKP